MAQQRSSRIKGAVMVRTEQQQDRLEAAITEEQITVGAGAATTEHIDKKKENVFFDGTLCNSGLKWDALL